MAGAASDPRGKAAGAGLLVIVAAAFAACATMQEPPGGPPDAEPPILLLVVPDSGSINEGFDDELTFEFDEIVTEQRIEDLVRVSPRHEEIKVSWKRSRITVEPKGGWHDSVAYQVTLLPGVQDLRSNRQTDGRTVIFSTGGEIPATTMSGAVIDWEAGRVARGALVEAVRLPDSLTYVAESDSVGWFTIPAAPVGTYLLLATIDQNNNGLRDRRESFDSVTVTLDSSVSRDFWTFPHDTVGPRIREVLRKDSMAIEVRFTQPLDTVPPGLDAITVLIEPDSIRAALGRTAWLATFDSLRAAARAAADSAAADSLPADSALADSAVVDSVAAPLRRLLPTEPRDPGARPGESRGGEAAPPDTSYAAQLLEQRSPLQTAFIIMLREPLQPGFRYLIEVTASNPLGISDTSSRPLVIPAAPDST